MKSSSYQAFFIPTKSVLQMRELIDITNAYAALAAEGKPSALATVVKVEGSSYRRPGARMLIAEDGRTWGCVSGGCLERDVARRALGAMTSGRCALARYETGDDEEVSNGASTGCGGTVEVLIQPLSADQPGPVSYLQQVLASRAPVELITVVRATGDLAAFCGQTISREELTGGPLDWPEHLRTFAMMQLGLIEDGLSTQTNDDAARVKPVPADHRGGAPAHADSWVLGLAAALGTSVDHAAIERDEADARAAETEQLNAVASPRIPAEYFNDADEKSSASVETGESPRLFVEMIEAPLELTIFGAGPDVLPLVTVAKTLGWRVAVVGSHPATHLHDRFKAADVLYVTGAADPVGGVEMAPGSAVVVMTHNVARDCDILHALPAGLGYIGVLGPKHRTDKILIDWPAAIEPATLHSPVGLDLEAESPEEIALSIAAEIQKWRRHGSGTSLREQAFIHHRPQHEPITPDDNAIASALQPAIATPV